MAKNPNPNSTLKIKQKRKRAKPEDDEQLASHDLPQTEDEQQIEEANDKQEEALEIDTNDKIEKIKKVKKMSSLISKLSFESLNLSQHTLRAITDMEFNDTTQVVY